MKKRRLPQAKRKSDGSKGKRPRIPAYINAHEELRLLKGSGRNGTKKKFGRARHSTENADKKPEAVETFWETEFDYKTISAGVKDLRRHSKEIKRQKFDEYVCLSEFA